jgi:hypothetical protein
MPIALFFAQATGISQMPDFIRAIVLVTSISPVLVYLNEVFAPIAVRHQRHMALWHVFEVVIGVLVLSGWVCYRLDIGSWDTIFAILFAQCNVWFSYLAARRVLEYQATSVIGGRYSFIIGAIVPVTFFIVLLACWGLTQWDFVFDGYFYLLVVLPNAAQYFYTRLGWMAKKYSIRHFDRSSLPSIELDQKGMLKYFAIAMLMAIIAQHWKIEVVAVASGFAAITVYLISPFSSFWLIISKANHLTKNVKTSSMFLMFITLLFSILSLFIASTNLYMVVVLAIVTQVLTVKFITDVRAKVMKPLSNSIYDVAKGVDKN